MIDRIALSFGIYLFSFQTLILGSLNYPIPELIVSFVFLPRLSLILFLFYPILGDYFLLNFYFSSIFLIGLLIKKDIPVNKYLTLSLKLIISIMTIVAFDQMLGTRMLSSQTFESPIPQINRVYLFFVEPSLVGPWAVFLGLLLKKAHDEKKIKLSNYNLFFTLTTFIAFSSIGLTGFISGLLLIIIRYGLNPRLLVFPLASLIILLIERLSSTDDLASVFTTGISSWRNIPDLTILANWKLYLIPQIGEDIKLKLGHLILQLFHISWLNNTFNLFSAFSTTYGLITLFLVLVGTTKRFNLNEILFLTFFLFLMPKYLAFIFYLFSRLDYEKTR
jgi:hypothetical protein